LITPIVLAAGEKSCTQVAGEMDSLSRRARAGQLQPDEYNGGTFTISNLGMYGITSFASIINPPHAAILSIGAARPTPVVVSGELRVATTATVTLTCDHRVVDGALGANWLNAFRRVVEAPQALFA
jgi:pyruvate dehydrogenase E2 component (dihydrolipoamide acetyltransferase)